MGSFGGHVLPGSFFILFGIWHITKLCAEYFKSLSRKDGPRFKTRTYFTCGCTNFPIEPFLKMTACLIGVMVETYEGFGDGYFKYLANAQHITMFAFFGVMGLLEMLHHYGFQLPPSSLHLSYILALFVEGILFYWHLMGRPLMDVQVHMLLIYIIAATIFAIGSEIRLKHSVTPALCRATLILMQGVWFCQVAFVLYPPGNMAKWKQDDHMQMMVVTVIFCAWAAVCFTTLCFIWFIIAARFGQARKVVVIANPYFRGSQNRKPFGDNNFKELGYRPVDDLAEANATRLNGTVNGVGKINHGLIGLTDSDEHSD